MEVFNAIGTILNFRGKLKKKELIGSFSTSELARNAVSSVANNYDEVEIVVTKIDSLAMQEL
jgi:hypothetical protein